MLKNLTTTDGNALPEKGRHNATSKSQGMAVARLKSIKTNTKKMKNKSKQTSVEPSNEEKSEFENLDSVVKAGISGFDKVGEALDKIRENKLWRAGDYATWEDYCRQAIGMSRAHASRLIKASRCLAELHAMGDLTIFPVSESQVRPLLRLTAPEDRRNAWDAAVVMADDHQPIANEVILIVSAIIEHGYDGEKSREKPPTRTQRRVEVISKLRTAVGTRQSWDEVENLLEELHGLL